MKCMVYCFGSLVISMLISNGGVGESNVTASPCNAKKNRLEPPTQVPQTVDIAVDAIQPHTAIGPGGEVFVAFLRRGNIEFVRSRDKRKSFSSPQIAIDVQGRARGGSHRGPRIGVDHSGVISVTAPVTFDDAEYKKRYPTSELFLTQSHDGGDSWSPPRRVNKVAKMAPEALHWMSVSPEGQVHIAWLDRRGRRGPGQDIYYSRIVNGKINQNSRIAKTVCECCAPGLAVSGTGNPLIAFREGGEKESREILALWSQNGGNSFTKATRVNNENTLEDG